MNMLDVHAFIGKLPQNLIACRIVAHASPVLRRAAQSSHGDCCVCRLPATGDDEIKRSELRRGFRYGVYAKNLVKRCHP
jgi:hypothetical protein